MKFLLLLFITISPSLLYSQDESPNLIMGIEEKNNLTFEIYDNVILKKEYSKIEEATNDTPENLLKSTLCANTQKWVDFNTLGGSAKSSKKTIDYFKKIDKLDKTKVFIKLIHKLSFNLGNIPTVIVKFYFYQDKSAPVSGVYVLQKIENRWYKTSNSSTSDLSIIVMRMKSDVLGEILSGTSNNDTIQKIYSRISENGVLKIGKLIEEFSSWYSPNEKEDILTIIKDPNTW
jgi:hypothetical protein